MHTTNTRIAASALAACLSLVPLSLTAADKPVEFKLATIAPRDSSYHRSLVEMGEKWRQITGGTVRLNVYPGGTLGSEADTVNLMQTGSLDASMLTVVGLSDIEPSVTALQNMPMAFRSLEEVDYVGEKLRPRLEQGLLAKGYLVLFWGDSGWVRFFTKAPILHPDDLRKLKIFTWAGGVHEFDLWKSSGFHPVSLETGAIGSGLLSGTVSAVPVPPVFALFGRFYGDVGKAKYMLELNWAPLVGAAVVRKKSWDRMPEDARQAMLKAAGEVGQHVKADGRRENEAAVEAMAKRGLIVQKVSPEIEAEWRSVAEGVYSKIRGPIVPADTFDEAQRLLKEYRAAHSSTAK